MVPQQNKYSRYWILWDTEDENEILMNDSDMEFMALEEIELIDNPGNANVFTPDANIYVANKKDRTR